MIIIYIYRKCNEKKTKQLPPSSPPHRNYEINEEQCESWTGYAKGSYRGFQLCQINDKAPSIFIHQSRPSPQSPTSLSGFLMLQLALNTSLKQHTPLLQKPKPTAEVQAAAASSCVLKGCGPSSIPPSRGKAELSPHSSPAGTDCQQGNNAQRSHRRAPNPQSPLPRIQTRRAIS